MKALENCSLKILKDDQYDQFVIVIDYNVELEQKLCNIIWYGAL